MPRGLMLRRASHSSLARDATISLSPWNSSEHGVCQLHCFLSRKSAVCLVSTEQLRAFGLETTIEYQHSALCHCKSQVSVDQEEAAASEGM